jgi:hypothetical protein
MSGFRCLTKEERAAIPPFFVYNTMVQCLHNSFDASHPMVDKLADRFAAEKVWAFAFLQDPQLRNSKIPECSFQRIVLASSRNELTPDLSPEMVVFHEMGHFIFFNGHGIPYDNENSHTVEKMCNNFAMQLYVRLLFLFPNYRTCCIDSTIIDFEDALRGHGLRYDLERNVQNSIRVAQEVIGD